ncbi:MAG: septal ring lytic transglycosylase RlpA family protein [Spirochaetota bacterium]|nr:septal ring lytic transglycosylase RlpA family protein [Spirochaetota bacterium]
MRNIIKGLLIIFGIIFVFMLLTACTPGKMVTKDEREDSKERIFAGNDEYNFDNYELENQKDLNNNGYDNYKDRNPDKDSLLNEKPVVSDIDEKYNNNNYPRSERFYQKGIASWYGRQFHGKVTASGERFNMNKFTAAHKTLPFGTVLKVKNLDNGKDVDVIINDRGPYIDGRIIDLSYAASRKLGMTAKGEAMVGISILRNGTGREYRRKGFNNEVEPVAGDSVQEDRYSEGNKYVNKNEDSSRYSPSYSDSRYSIQTGAFYSRRNAEKLRDKLKEMFENPIGLVRKDDLYKVTIEGVRFKDELVRYKKMLKDESIPYYVLYNE